MADIKRFELIYGMKFYTYDGIKYLRPGWAKLGLGIIAGGDRTDISFLKDGEKHDMVVSFIARHSNEEDFEEKYFHKNGAIKYFTVLELAEKEKAAA